MTREELKDKVYRLDLGDYGVEIEDYLTSNGYICDIFSEIADGNTSIYYGDISRYIANHVDEVNDTISEFGWEGCGSDLYKAGQMAEYTSIERDLEEHIDDIIVYAALVDKFDDDIPEDAFEKVYDNVSNVDWNEKLESAIHDALSVLDEEEDEEEEDE